MTSPQPDAPATSPEGRLVLTPDEVRDLRSRVDDLAAQDTAVLMAVRAGEDVHDAIAAGCPPQFHPGVDAHHATVLETVRSTLGLDRGTEVEVPSADDARLVGALGCTVVVSSGQAT